MHSKIELQIIVFLSGASVMVYEIVGSRIFAPYLGTSTYIWTSIIGVILGSLSFGYWYGGKVADKHPHMKTVSIVLLVAAIAVGGTVIFKDIILGLLQLSDIHLAVSAVIASLLLFAPASFFLGMISPLAVRLKIDTREHAGSVAGNLYALSTVGSIVGTFFAGFVLIPLVGSSKILFGIVGVLVLLSVLANSNTVLAKKGALIFFGIAIGVTIGVLDSKLAQAGFTLLDTEYNAVKIYDVSDTESGRPVRFLQLNTEAHSAIYLDDEGGFVFNYLDYYDLIDFFNPTHSKALMIGGGAYVYPNEYIKKHKDAHIDVVEIDKDLFDIAKMYFNLSDDPRLRTITDDGRRYIDTTDEIYDVIFMDAFTSYYSVPYQLATKEAVSGMFDILSDEGVVIVNMIGSLYGDNSQFINAEYQTYGESFPYVYIFKIGSKNVFDVQNYILVASKQEREFMSDNEEINNMLSTIWQGTFSEKMEVLTDEYAPVDYYMSGMLSQQWK